MMYILTQTELKEAQELGLTALFDVLSVLNSIDENHRVQKEPLTESFLNDLSMAHQDGSLYETINHWKKKYVYNVD